MLEKWLRKRGKIFNHNGVFSFSLGFKRPMFRKVKHADFGLGAHVVFGGQWLAWVRVGPYSLSLEKDTIPF